MGQVLSSTGAAVFIGDRIFPLLGYELAEGKEDPDSSKKPGGSNSTAPGGCTALNRDFLPVIFRGDVSYLFRQNKYDTSSSIEPHQRTQ